MRELGAQVGELAVDDAQAVDQLRVGGLAVARLRAQRGGDAGVAADEIGELVGADLVATRRPGDEWDIAAAAPIAAEAGVTVSDALSRRLVFNQATPRASGVLASAAGLHDAAVARLAERARTLTAEEKG